MSDTRAIRNRNPLNLRPSGDKWQGLKEEQTDPGYLQFQTNFHGLRAGAINLLTYYRIHKRRTVKAIISAWAPPSDNNPTHAYIATVCNALGVGPDDPVNLENGDILRRLMEAMIKVEAGAQPFSRVDLETAINAAYGAHQVHSPPEKNPVPAPVPIPVPPMSSKESPGPRDEIVPPPPKPDKPELVNQPTSVPTRKVVAGGLAGAIAFIVMIGWNRLFPSAPMPAEYATEIAGAVILVATLVTQYFTRNRATDVPRGPTPETSVPEVSRVSESQGDRPT